MTDGLPPLREVIAHYDLGAKKSLGQHFLLDLNLTGKIARIADSCADDCIIEIGPGPGGLTRSLLKTGASVIAIEKDARCIAALADVANAFPGKLRLVEDDALGVDERQIISRDETMSAGPVKIVANLPYNISTELLIKWLRANQTTEPLWSLMALMFQKEVADRILAAPGSKTYGRLSVIAQAASHPARAFNLPARAFTPPPKVDSSVVVFTPTPTPLEDLPALERVTHAAFSQRRKMLRSSLKSVFGGKLETVLKQMEIPQTARAEELSVQQFIGLASFEQRLT